MLIDQQNFDIKDMDDEQLHERIECREIINKIHDFGVSQRQLLMLIEMLALELENRELMLNILNIVSVQNG